MATTTKSSCVKIWSGIYWRKKGVVKMGGVYVLIAIAIGILVYAWMDNDDDDQSRPRDAWDY